MPLPLTTERLVVRAPEPGDLDAFAALFADPEVMRHIGAGAVWDRDLVRESMDRKKKRLAERGFTLFTVVRRDDGRVIGDCGLAPWEDGEIEIGWRFARAYWGQGYAGEAARAVFDHARQELGLRRLACLVQEDNVASWRIAERLGFTLDRVEVWYETRRVRVYTWSTDS